MNTSFDSFFAFLQIQLHGWDVEALHDHVDPSDLAEEFGGDQPPLPTGTLIKLFPGEL